MWTLQLSHFKHIVELLSFEYFHFLILVQSCTHIFSHYEVRVKSLAFYLNLFYREMKDTLLYKTNTLQIQFIFYVKFYNLIETMSFRSRIWHKYFSWSNFDRKTTFCWRLWFFLSNFKESRVFSKIFPLLKWNKFENLFNIICFSLDLELDKKKSLSEWGLKGGIRKYYFLLSNLLLAFLCKVVGRHRTLNKYLCIPYQNWVSFNNKVSSLGIYGSPDTPYLSKHMHHNSKGSFYSISTFPIFCYKTVVFFIKCCWKIFKIFWFGLMSLNLRSKVGNNLLCFLFAVLLVWLNCATALDICLHFSV